MTRDRRREKEAFFCRQDDKPTPKNGPLVGCRHREDSLRRSDPARARTDVCVGPWIASAECRRARTEEEHLILDAAMAASKTNRARAHQSASENAKTRISF
jgi:hypothetical protein